jgi:hypothetical protein
VANLQMMVQSTKDNDGFVVSVPNTDFGAFFYIKVNMMV